MASKRVEGALMARIRSSDITDRRVYLNRRTFMQSMLAAGGATLVAGDVFAQKPAPHGRKLSRSDA